MAILGGSYTVGKIALQDLPVFGLLLPLLFEPGEAWHVSASAVASVLYLGVVAACLGFVLVVWLTRTYSARR